jgi:uncharacterized protein
MRKDGGEGGAPRGGQRDHGGGKPAPRSPAPQRQPEKPSQGAFGAALAEAMKRK